MIKNKKNEQDVKLSFALFANISLLNLYQFIKKNNLDNKQINTSNQHESKFLLENGQSIFSKTNFFQLITKHAKDKEAKANEIFAKIVSHIRISRNWYSHSNTSIQYIKNKNHYDQSLDDLISQIKEIINASSSWIHFQKFRNREWDTFFIQMFLYKSEWNEFYDYIEKMIETSKQFHRKFRVRLRKIINNDMMFDFKIINYLKSFNEIKNKKKGFLNIAIKSLNYFLKPSGLKFSFAHQTRRGLIVNCKNDQDQFKSLNLQGIRQILLGQSLEIQKNPKYRVSIKNFAKKDIKKEIQQIGSEYYEKHYRLFRLKVDSKSLIPVNHLLKILGKTLKFKDSRYENGLGQTLFNQLLQFLQSHNENYLNKKHETTKMLMDILKITNSDDHNKWILKIKTYIKESIGLEDYSKIFEIKKQNESNNPNIWDQNPKLSTFSNELIPDALYEPLFNFKNQKTKEQDVIKKLIAPILIFYYHNKKQNEKDFFNEVELENLFGETKELPIEFKIIKKCFEKRISKSRSKIINYDDIANNESLEINVENKHHYYQSHYELVNSKIFIEMAKLLKKDSSDTSVEVEKVIKEIEKYKNRELDLVKWALENEDEKNKKRDFIMHRSLSKFSNLSSVYEIISNSKKPFRAPKNFLKSQKNKNAINNLDDKMRDFKEEMQK